MEYLHRGSPVASFAVIGALPCGLVARLETIGKGSALGDSGRHHNVSGLHLHAVAWESFRMVFCHDLRVPVLVSVGRYFEANISCGGAGCGNCTKVDAMPIRCPLPFRSSLAVVADSMA